MPAANADNKRLNDGVVAVYGAPSESNETIVGAPGNLPLDPSPDYDGSDEVEYGLDWLPWILRGVYPPPAYPST